MRAPAWVAIAVVALTACRGGCKKNDDHHRAIAAMGPKVIDCPPGLARCEGASVWASSGGTVSNDCATPESCLCPWTHVGSCARACVADDVTVIADRNVAVAQLCESGVNQVQAASDERIPCDGPAWLCSKGNLFRCADDATSATAEGTCIRGCAKVSGVDEMLPLPVAGALLCAR